MDILYYLTYDLPVPYRNIKLYPVTVKDYLLFNIYAQCLLLEKNSIPDPKIIMMSELEYIFYATAQDFEKNPFLFWFDRLLSLCIRDDESFKDIQKSIRRYGQASENEKPYFTIGEEKYYSSDFAEIKNIIARQNLLELPDENISKEVRDSLEKAREYKNKMNGKPASFEDYLVSLSVSTGWTLDFIYNMSIRKFTKSIRRMDNLIHYKIYLASSMSGMVEFKDKSFIKHWLTDLEDKEKYDDVSMDLNEVQNKISLESAKQ